MHVYKHLTPAARRAVLCNTRDDRGTWFETVQLHDDGAPRVTGHRAGASAFFGQAITRYDGSTRVLLDSLHHLR